MGCPLRAMAAMGKTAWFALMNWKSPTAPRRSPVRTRPRLLRGCRAPTEAAAPRGVDGPVPPARRASGRHSWRRHGSHRGRLERLSCGWPGRRARTRGRDRPGRVRRGPIRPSGGKTRGRRAGVYEAWSAPRAESLEGSTRPGQLHGEVVCGSLLVAGGDAAILLEPTDQPLDLVALAIGGFVEIELAGLILAGGDHRLDPALSEATTGRRTGVALVACRPAGT